MSGRIVRLDISIHQTVQELLPWFVTETLDPDDLALVQEHLQHCTQCQADVDWQRKLCALPPTAGATPDMERSLAQLLPRLGARRYRPKSAALVKWWRTLAGGGTAWMRWGLAAQFAVILGLAFMLVRPGDDTAAYRVLGAAGKAGGNVVVVFKPETTERELRRILLASGARVVDGPTVTDAYLLKVSDAQRTIAINGLRAEPAVVLAESLDSGGGP